MKPYLQIIIAMLIWSTWGLVIRWLAMPATAILFYSSFIASITVPIVLAIRGELDLSGVSGAGWSFVILAASSIANNLTYFYALAHTTVSNAVFTHYTAPVFVVLLAPLLIGERLHRSTLLSLPLAAAGMCFILFAQGGFTMEPDHLGGILAGTASGAAYALIILFSRRLSAMLMHHKAVVVLLWATTVATAPFAFLMDYTISLKSAVLLLITGMLHSTLCPLLYYDALRKVLAQHAAILGYMEPLAAVPLAFLLLGERPAAMALLGGTLILASGYLVIHARLRKERTLS